jgi:hypothetical integral membrane protein (TIGR02206 family)
MHDKFVLFGHQHLIVIALTFAVPAILVTVQRRSRQRADAAIRRFFAGLLTGTWVAWYVLFIGRHWLGIGNALPMNLCDWATIALLAALIRPGQKAYELAYFWALAGTMQGLVTPDVNFAFPEPQFVLFLLGHATIIASVIYLTFGTGMRPAPESIPRVMLWTLGYAASAALVDGLLGANYGFFRAKPGHATFYDLMPVWPYYIPEVVALGVLAILLLYAPWYIADRLRKPRTAHG